VDDCHKREIELITIFNNKFKLTRGREYFEGNINDMIFEFNNFCDQFKINNKIIINETFLNEKINNNTNISKNIGYINNNIINTGCYKCNKCKNEYSSLQALERHTNKKFKCDIINKYQCKVCNKSFKYNKNLQEHFQKTLCNEINTNDNNKAIIDILQNEMIIDDKLFFLKKLNIILSTDEIIKIINSSVNINTKITLLISKR